MAPTMTKTTVTLAPGAVLETIVNASPDFLELLRACRQEVTPQLNQRPTLKIFGREVQQPRNVGFFSDRVPIYIYSRQPNESKPMTDNLRTLMAQVNEMAGTKFNAILINEYVSGKDYISAHTDEELGLIMNHDSCVATVSIGATRTFRVRNKNTREIMRDTPTTEGHLLIMRGSEFQRVLTHEIPKLGKREHDMGGRVSFTFREHCEFPDRAAALAFIQQASKPRAPKRPLAATITNHDTHEPVAKKTTPQGLPLPIVHNVRAAHIQPMGYTNLREWCQDPENVYIGRGNILIIDGMRYPPQSSVWANPFKSPRDGTHEEVIAKYRRHIRNLLRERPELEHELRALAGKRIGCWCVARPTSEFTGADNGRVQCHGQLVVEMFCEICA